MARRARLLAARILYQLLIVEVLPRLAAPPENPQSYRSFAFTQAFENTNPSRESRHLRMAGALSNIERNPAVCSSKLIIEEKPRARRTTSALSRTSVLGYSSQQRRCNCREFRSHFSRLHQFFEHFYKLLGIGRQRFVSNAEYAPLEVGLI